MGTRYCPRLYSATMASIPGLALPWQKDHGSPAAPQSFRTRELFSWHLPLLLWQFSPISDIAYPRLLKLFTFCGRSAILTSWNFAAIKDDQERFFGEAVDAGYWNRNRARNNRDTTATYSRNIREIDATPPQQSAKNAHIKKNNLVNQLVMISRKNRTKGTSYRFMPQEGKGGEKAGKSITTPLRNIREIARPRQKHATPARQTNQRKMPTSRKITWQIKWLR